jgi:chloramphenicol 3-O-phosphotransferase
MASAGAPGASAQLLFVSGAPGAGKSTVAQALLELGSDALVFDADWLLEPTSELVGRDLSLTETSDLWPLYDRLWAAILAMIARNGRRAVLLTPMDPGSLPAVPWPGAVGWCLLDCDDATRSARLAARGWSEAEIAEALADARALREQIAFVIDTSGSTPSEAAARVAGWVEALAHDRR